MAVHGDLPSFDEMGSFGISGLSLFLLGIDDQQLNHDLLLHHQILAASCHDRASSLSVSAGSLSSMEVLPRLSLEDEKQNLEMNWFLQMENQRLRSVLQEATRQQAVLLQRHCESRMTTLMLTKDEEIAIARNKTFELQDFLKRTEIEAQAWKTSSAEKEAIAFDLNNRLNQLRDRESLFPNAISSCNASSSTRIKDSKKKKKKIACKSCQERALSVVFFPCKHLCCCKNCEPLLGHCPVCSTVKHTSLEVLFCGKKSEFC